MKGITEQKIEKFREFLLCEEKAFATVEKYVRDVRTFARWLGEEEITKGGVLKFKALLAKKYAFGSVNSILSSLNCFFSYCGISECRVKNIRRQRQSFLRAETELTKEEYSRLLNAAEKKDIRLFLLLQTICASGMRVSELSFVTVASLKNGVVEINCKGKVRNVFLPTKLCKNLKKYCKERQIKSGSVFITKSGKPINRSNIWKSMKGLCSIAGISEAKVFPHNLRHLFARTYYGISKDIVRLADILGHSSVNTTRIYTMECARTYQKQIQGLGLISTT